MKVGDKVIITRDHFFGSEGKTGTVVWHDTSDDTYLVDVNDFNGGHSGRLHAPKEIYEKYSDSCLFYPEEFLEGVN